MPASAAGAANQELHRTLEALREENERLAAECEESTRRITLAHGELAQLRETVVALRAELDTVRLEAQGRAHRAVAAAQGEVTQLRETIVALRDEREALRVASEANARRSAVAARDEVAELQQTIVRLHEESEELRMKKDAIAKATADASRDEILQLQATIGSLRDALLRARSTNRDDDLAGAGSRPTGAMRDADS